MPNEIDPMPAYILDRHGNVLSEQTQSQVIGIMDGVNATTPNVTTPLDLVTGTPHLTNVTTAVISVVPNGGTIGVVHDILAVAGTLVQGREVNTYVATGGAGGSLADGVAVAVILSPLPGGSYIGGALGSGIGNYVGQGIGYATYINDNAPTFNEAINFPPSYIKPDGTSYSSPSSATKLLCTR